jgi:hypothetical protein
MNNPPAFPHFGHTGWSNSGGMTLRDYFAAKAMQSFITLQEEALTRDGCMCDWSKDGTSSEIISEQAYGVADAMLAEREKT